LGDTTAVFPFSAIYHPHFFNRKCDFLPHYIHPVNKTAQKIKITYHLDFYINPPVMWQKFAIFNAFQE